MIISKNFSVLVVHKDPPLFPDLPLILFPPPLSRMTNQAHVNAGQDRKPHFVLVPMMAQGHMIPMVDMAHLLAGRGTLVSLITTPVNASRIKPIIDRVAESNLPLRFVTLRFPCAEAGLPEGCENLDALPSRDLVAHFLQATTMLREPLAAHLRQQLPGPSCIISDVFQPWTRDVAREFGVPRLTFNGFGCFALLIRHINYYDKIFESTVDDDEPLVVPGLPHRIEITRAQALGNFVQPGTERRREEMMIAEAAADGVVVNSYDDLEPSYREWYQKTVGKKVWTIGPMLLCNRNVADMAARGNKASIDEDRCLRWLDSMRPSSVIYVSFGSLARTPLSQLIEIGLGLEASNCPFIWVIKSGNKFAEVEEWLSEGFEERTGARGLIIRGWAPQMMILSHPSVGGFMTHCGWNSVLESVSTGVPMITWPHFADQFLNEKLIVEVLRIGLAVRVKSLTMWGLSNDQVVSVKRNEVQKAVSILMDDGKEGEERRQRARELGERAKKAVEQGGSSYENLTHLINYAQTSIHCNVE